MTSIIARRKAIEMICREELTHLTLSERESLLLDWWQVDEDDPEFELLSEALKKKTYETDVPNDVGDPEYDSLILIALEHSYRGIRNEYLAERLQKVGLGRFRVDGEMETLFPCPCCGYLTLDSRGEYDICPICFWEDTGNDLDQYSSPNRMTLEEGKANFERFGAISLEQKKYVDLEGTRKWPKSNRLIED